MAYPLTLLSAAVRAMRESLEVMKAGGHPSDRLLDFAELRRIVGFDDYYAEEARYAAPGRAAKTPTGRRRAAE